MNESVPSTNQPDLREKRSGKPRRSERMAARGVDLHKKQLRTGAVAAGGLLALVGIAAMFLGN